MTIVGLDGELDAETAPQVDEAIERALAHDSTVIVLDCSLLRSMGHEDAIVLLDTYERVHDVDATLAIRQPPDEARRVIEEAGLGDTIDIEE
jgi:anti-anti-sigma factor